MGIPKFYRWISERYPLIVQPIGDSAVQPFDTLFLDVNGIIHSCGHPYEDAARNNLTVEYIAASTFRFLSHLVATVRPRRLLYIAVDGVAPRAKMNQQRARRFRTAQDAEAAKQALIEQGKPVPSDLFDSNAISPGTEFMAAISEHLKFCIARKQTEDPLWQNLSVVFSGQEVPGEGEHKIMEYIRQQKASGSPSWGPDQMHCLYGLDADLIILGLVTHEANVAILREESLTMAALKSKRKDVPQPFQLLHLSLLREYLAKEFAPTFLTFPFDVERFVDDFALMMCLIGNDFLPGLPGLSIADGGLQAMLDMYKNSIASIGGYLTDGSSIVPERLNAFLGLLSQMETDSMSLDALSKLDDFGDQQQQQQRQQMRKSQSKMLRGSGKHVRLAGLDIPLSIDGKDDDDDNDDDDDGVGDEPMLSFGGPDDGAHGHLEDDDDDEGESDDDDDQIPTRYKAHVGGMEWREAYYISKFGLNGSMRNRQFHEELGKAFLDGIAWVLRYYHDGCASWEWFFPYHYAPCVAELAELSWQQPVFGPSVPFLPLQQLLAVLPPASQALLPATYRGLMTKEDSPVIDFYPRDFESDLNGKKNDWEAVILIPFIKVERLLAAMEEAEAAIPLTAQERARNTFGKDLIFGFFPSKPHPLATTLPGIIPSMADCRSISVAVESHAPIKPRLTSQLPRLARRMHPSTPTFGSIEHTTYFKCVGVRMHMSPSRSPSLVIHVSGGTSEPTVEAAAAELAGKTAYVNWPYLWEAKVGAVADAHCSMELKPGQQEGFVRRSHDDPLWWASETSFQRHELLTKRAIDVGEISILVEVFPLQGIIERHDGSRMKWYGDTPFLVPYQLVVKSIPEVDARWSERPAAAVSDLFPVGSPVIYLKSPHAYGLGRVTRTTPAPAALDVAIRAPEPQPDIRAVVSTVARASDLPSGGGAWISLMQAAQHLRCSLETVSKITGKLLFMPGRHNLGLMLRVNKENLQVAGWCRRNPQRNFWEISDKALHTVLMYRQVFPQIFNVIEKNPDERTYDVSMLDAPSEPGSKVVQNAKAWIKSQEFSDCPLVPIGTKALSRASVNAIDAALRFGRDAQPPALGSPSAAAPAESAVTSVPPSFVVRPIPSSAVPLAVQLSPDAVAMGLGDSLDLGSRVMNILNDGTVTFGALGTVIAMKGTVLDVLFDQPFFAGTELGGICPNFRGASRERRHLLLVRTEICPQAPSNASDSPLRRSNERVSGNQRAASPQSWQQQLLLQQDQQRGKASPQSQGQPQQQPQPPRAVSPQRQQYQQPPQQQQRPVSPPRHQQQPQQRQVGQQKQQQQQQPQRAPVKHAPLHPPKNVQPPAAVQQSTVPPQQAQGQRPKLRMERPQQAQQAQQPAQQQPAQQQPVQQPPPLQGQRQKLRVSRNHPQPFQMPGEVPPPVFPEYTQAPASTAAAQPAQPRAAPQQAQALTWQQLQMLGRSK